MENLLLSLAEIHVTMAAVILILLLFSQLFGKKYSARCRYLVWTVVILRLCIPLGTSFVPAAVRLEIPLQSAETIGEQATDTPETSPAPETDGYSESVPPVSIAPDNSAVIEGFTPPETTDQLFDASETKAPETTAPAVNPVIPAETSELQTWLPSELPTEKPAETSTETSADVPAKKLPNVIEVLNLIGIVWLAGAVVTLIWRLGGYAVASRKMRKLLRAAPAEYDMICRALAEKLNIRKIPPLFISNATHSPMLCGYFKPIIILPNMEFSENSLIGILAHELTHYKRHDLWVKLLCIIAQSLGWFNPLVYIASARCNSEMELSCDEAVLRGLDKSARISYGNTMLDIIRACSGEQSNLTTHFNPRKSAVRERFQGILDSSKKKRGVGVIVIVAVLCVLAGTIIACTIDDGSDENDRINEILNSENAEYYQVSYSDYTPNESGIENVSVESTQIRTILRQTTVDGVDVILYTTTDGGLFAAYRQNDEGNYTRFFTIAAAETEMPEYSLERVENVLGMNGFAIEYDLSENQKKYFIIENGAPKLCLSASRNVIEDDFDGDGMTEVVTQDTNYFSLFDSVDGKIVYCSLPSELHPISVPRYSDALHCFEFDYTKTDGAKGVYLLRGVLDGDTLAVSPVPDEWVLHAEKNDAKLYYNAASLNFNGCANVFRLDCGGVELFFTADCQLGENAPALDIHDYTGDGVDDVRITAADARGISSYFQYDPALGEMYPVIPEETISDNSMAELPDDELEMVGEDYRAFVYVRAEEAGNYTASDFLIVLDEFRVPVRTNLPADISSKKPIVRWTDVTKDNESDVIVSFTTGSGTGVRTEEMFAVDGVTGKLYHLFDPYKYVESLVNTDENGTKWLETDTVDHFVLPDDAYFDQYYSYDYELENWDMVIQAGVKIGYGMLQYMSEELLITYDFESGVFRPSKISLSHEEPEFSTQVELPPASGEWLYILQREGFVIYVDSASIDENGIADKFLIRNGERTAEFTFRSCRVGPYNPMLNVFDYSGDGVPDCNIEFDATDGALHQFVFDGATSELRRVTAFEMEDTPFYEEITSAPLGSYREYYQMDTLDAAEDSPLIDYYSAAKSLSNYTLSGLATSYIRRCGPFVLDTEDISSLIETSVTKYFEPENITISSLDSLFEEYEFPNLLEYKWTLSYPQTSPTSPLYQLYDNMRSQRKITPLIHKTEEGFFSDAVLSDDVISDIHKDIYTVFLGRFITLVDPADLTDTEYTDENGNKYVQIIYQPSDDISVILYDGAEPWVIKTADGTVLFPTEETSPESLRQAEFTGITVTSLEELEKYCDNKKYLFTRTYDFFYDLLSGESEYPEFNTLVIEDYTIRFCDPIQDYTIYFDFTVKESGLDTLPVGEYHTIVRQTVDLSFSLTSQNTVMNSPFSDVKEVKMLQTFFFGSHFWNTPTFGESIKYPGMHNFICNYYGDFTSQIPVDEFKRLAAEKFGCTEVKDEDMILHSDGMVEAGAIGGWNSYAIEDVSKSNGMTTVTVQFYADSIKLLKSHKIAYYIGEDETWHGYDIVEQSEYPPYGMEYYEDVAPKDSLRDILTEYLGTDSNLIELLETYPEFRNEVCSLVNNILTAYRNGSDPLVYLPDPPSDCAVNFPDGIPIPADITSDNLTDFCSFENSENIITLPLSDVYSIRFVWNIGGFGEAVAAYIVRFDVISDKAFPVYKVSLSADSWQIADSSIKYSMNDFTPESVTELDDISIPVSLNTRASRSELLMFHKISDISADVFALSGDIVAGGDPQKAYVFMREADGGYKRSILQLKPKLYDTAICKGVILDSWIDDGETKYSLLIPLTDGTVTQYIYDGTNWLCQGRLQSTDNSDWAKSVFADGKVQCVSFETPGGDPQVYISFNGGQTTYQYNIPLSSRYTYESVDIVDFEASDDGRFTVSFRAFREDGSTFGITYNAETGSFIGELQETEPGGAHHWYLYYSASDVGMFLSEVLSVNSAAVYNYDINGDLIKISDISGGAGDYSAFDISAAVTSPSYNIPLINAEKLDPETASSYDGVREDGYFDLTYEYNGESYGPLTVTEREVFETSAGQAIYERVEYSTGEYYYEYHVRTAHDFIVKLIFQNSSYPEADCRDIVNSLVFVDNTALE